MASSKPIHLNTFTKSDRLSGKKEITDLFQKGLSIKANPLKALFLITENLQKPQVLISVPKRNFKKASARNLLKRRIREAYRINKHLLNVRHGNNPMIAYIYLDTASLPYVEIEDAMKTILGKMNQIINKK